MRCFARVRLKKVLLGVLFILICLTFLKLDHSFNRREHKKGQKSFRNGRRVASISGEEVDVIYWSNRGNGTSTNTSPNITSFKQTPSKSNIVIPVKFLPNSMLDTKIPTSHFGIDNKMKDTKDTKGARDSKDAIDSMIHKRVFPNFNKVRKVSGANRPVSKSLDGVNKMENFYSVNRNVLQDLSNRIAGMNDVESVDISRFVDTRKKFQNLHSLSRGYQNRVPIANATLPSTWTLKPELYSKLKQRKQHVTEVCHERGLDFRNGTYQPNAWEFVVSEKHPLAWCTIFKAASSTWFYNFNIMAGYTEKQLLKAKDTPISLARKKYPRIDVARLDEIMNNGSYLSFMIVRHPLDRLVSGFRDKIETGNRFYRDISKKIISKYPNIAGPKKAVEIVIPEEGNNLKRKAKPKLKHISPSFAQFVQFLIDSDQEGEKLNEHWIPMSTFCTPCLVDFDVYLKTETLNEDGNYVIFTSGIEKIIKPKLINRSKNGPTENVTKSYLCSLSKSQKEGIVKLYQLDFDLFQYDYKKYFDCDKT